MTSQQYERWTAPLRARPKLTRGLVSANKILTYLCYVLYPCLLVILLLTRSPLLLRSFLTPAISFVLLSLVRKKINCPRPYETLDITPLIHKNTKGKSFPSRHVFSVFVIAGTWFAYCPVVGIILGVIGLSMAVVRVLGGVHYPRDVAAGAAAGIVSCVIGFVLIP